MGYWKTKVLPKLKKVFEKDNSKKLAATEACKSFDDSKVEISKEFEEKKSDLGPKVIEIYEASTTEIKALIKNPKEAGLKKHSTAVHTFIQKLVEIDFPGSKPVSEVSSKFGPSLIPGPVFFIFEKVSTFIVVEEKEETTTKDKDIVIETDKKDEEEVVVAVEPPSAAEPTAAPATPEPPPKAEELPPKTEEPEVTPPKP